MEEVVITVNGGVAEVVQVPAGVKVTIRDFDVHEETDHKDEDGNYYEEGSYILEDGEVVGI